MVAHQDGEHGTAAPCRGEVARTRQALVAFRAPTPRTWTGSVFLPANHYSCLVCPSKTHAIPAREWHGAARLSLPLRLSKAAGVRRLWLTTRKWLEAHVTAVQVRHAVEDRVSAARQEA